MRFAVSKTRIIQSKINKSIDLPDVGTVHTFFHIIVIHLMSAQLDSCTISYKSKEKK